MRTALLISALAGLAAAVPRPQAMDIDEVEVSQPACTDYSIKLIRSSE